MHDHSNKLTYICIKIFTKYFMSWKYEEKQRPGGFKNNLNALFSLCHYQDSLLVCSSGQVEQLKHRAVGSAPGKCYASFPHFGSLDLP